MKSFDTCDLFYPRGVSQLFFQTNLSKKKHIIFNSLYLQILDFTATDIKFCWYIITVDYSVMTVTFADDVHSDTDIVIIVY